MTWHDTIDCVLNPLNNSTIDRFAELVQLARGRIEFHIVSYCGPGRAPQTEADANNLAGYCRQQGLAFSTDTIVGDPVDPTGKAPS